MTLPDERYNALKRARDFLRDLMDPQQTPRVPKSVRIEARYRLKHYPTDYELETIAKKCPKLLQEKRNLQWLPQEKTK